MNRLGYRSGFCGRQHRLCVHRLALAAGMVAVVAAVTPIAAWAGEVTSTFSVNDEGWQVVSFAHLRMHDYGVVGRYVPNYRATGGNPGGYIWKSDPDSGDFTFSAPSEYLGNKAGSYGLTLSYDLLHSGGVDYQASDVILVGAGTRLLWQSSPNIIPQENVWTSVSVTFSPSAQWHIGRADGPLATAADFRSVLSDLQGMYIRGEYKNGSEVAGLDNVSLGSRVPVPSSHLALLSLGGVGILYWFRMNQKNRGWGPQSRKEASR